MSQVHEVQLFIFFLCFQGFVSSTWWRLKVCLSSYALSLDTNWAFIGNSVERIQQYLDIEQEKAATDSGTPSAAWPVSGSLSVERLSARYSPDGPEVLREISFMCESGEKIGIGT